MVKRNLKKINYRNILLLSILLLGIVFLFKESTSVLQRNPRNEHMNPIVSEKGLTLNEAKRLYKDMSTEEKQAARACVVREVGFDGLKNIIEDVKNKSVDSGTYDILSGCLQDVHSSFQSATDYEDQYEGELVKPADRDPNRWATARCNDGTPFAFKIEKPKNNPSNNWVIYFQGGGMCDDNALSCAERTQDTPLIVTTLPGRDGQKYQIIGNQGIFNHDPEINPLFYNANKVYAHYCSSDVWSGSTSELHETSAGDWYFSGRINAKAMFEILKEQYGLDDSNPDTNILLSGGSAGCIGANVNAEQAVQLFPNTAKSGNMKIVSDGCYIPTYDNPDHPLGNSDDSIQEVVELGYYFWDSSINAICENDQRNANKEPGSCLLGANLYRYTTVCDGNGLCLPNLVQNSSIDNWAVKAHHIDPKASASNLALEDWRNNILREIQNEDIEWLFSGGNVSYHTLLMKDIGWEYGPQDEPTFGEFVNAFWLGEQPQRLIFGNP